MPFSLPPSVVKLLLPTLSSSICERWKRLINYPTVLTTLVEFLFKEDGTPSDELATEICALPCTVGSGGTGGGGGGGTPNPSMPAPTALNATDGSFSDKIQITWNAVTPPAGIAAVTAYKLYRAISTETDPDNATLIATVTAPTTTYDDPVDTDLIVGTVYAYWATATNGTDTSAFSSSDVGSASAPTSDLDAITDLRCSQGFSAVSGVVSLAWTPPAGATKFDVWRNAVNDFATATKIWSNVIPETPDHYTPASSSPESWNNTDEIVLYDDPPSDTAHYFYWVVSKKDSPPAESDESNSSEGWVRTFFAPYLGTPFEMQRGDSLVEGVDFDGTDLYIVFIGSGAGGAGGGTTYGGGGGGGADVVVLLTTIAPGDTIALVASNPNADDTGNAAALANGADGSDLELQVNGTPIIDSVGPDGGLYSGSGSGAGGAAGSTTAAGATIYPGHAGQAASGAQGGRSGYAFSQRRLPPGHYNGNFTLGSWTGDAVSPGYAGSGVHSSPGAESLAVGGFGKCGYVVIVPSGP